MAATPNGSTLTDPLQNVLGYQLRRASVAAMTALKNALAEIGLKPSEMSVLMVIGANPAATQSDIGRCLSIKRANMAPIVNRLEGQHLLRRSSVDGRSQALHLTDAGEELVAKAWRVIESHEAKLRAGIDGPTRQSILSFLQGLQTGIVDEPDLTG